METQVVIVPGWHGSGEGHWQTLWQARHPEYERLEQEDWDNPDAAAWTAALERHLANLNGPVVLVAHSLGCLAVVHWVWRGTLRNIAKISAALLVVPPDVNSLPGLRTFRPVPRQPLPFRSLVVGSENDPYCRLATAQRLAASWRSEFANAGRAGHINVDSGHGDWPQGETLLKSLIEGMGQTAPRAIAC